ncbi:MAG: type II secretion system protein, partial [Candidatus Saccharibacteria bacterium]
MNTKLQQRKGFTIIEVVLVLAIAALIILMVFIAWPALQRTQRDQARKSDVALIGSTISTFKSNNRGRLPNICELNRLVFRQGTSIYQAVNCEGAAAVTGSNIITQATVADGDAAVGIEQVIVVPGGRCDGNNVR